MDTFSGRICIHIPGRVLVLCRIQGLPVRPVPEVVIVRVCGICSRKEVGDQGFSLALLHRSGMAGAAGNTLPETLGDGLGLVAVPGGALSKRGVTGGTGRVDPVLVALRAGVQAGQPPAAVQARFLGAEVHARGPGHEGGLVSLAAGTPFRIPVGIVLGRKAP